MKRLELGDDYHSSDTEESVPDRHSDEDDDDEEEGNKTDPIIYMRC